MIYLELIFYLIVIVGGIVVYVLWLNRSAKKDEERKRLGLAKLPIQHKKVKIFFLFLGILIISLYLQSGTSVSQELYCDKRKGLCTYTVYDTYDKERIAEFTLTPQVRAQFYKEQVRILKSGTRRHSSLQCLNDWRKNNFCYDMHYYVKVSSHDKLMLFFKDNGSALVDWPAPFHENMVKKFNQYVQSPETVFTIQYGKRTDYLATVLTFLLVFGFLGVVMYLIGRKKEKKD